MHNYAYNGQQQTESEAYEIFRAHYSEDLFCECMNDNEPLVKVAGYEYEAGNVLRMVDYTAFREQYLIDLDYMWQEFRINGDCDIDGLTCEEVD